ncbi:MULTISPECIES: hypothetical protein [Aeromicrobium]|uniref:hypothetical protein n=1 Tax=Aeromicrobium TaxID=2040 RepID=UPI0025802D14|nr:MULTISPECIES: hypothetical protein [Aeromicrobium]
MADVLSGGRTFDPARFSMTSLLHRALLAFALTGTFLIAPAAAADAAPKKPAKVTKIRAKTSTSTLTIHWARPARAKKVAICVKTAPRARSCIRKVKTRRNSITFRALRPNSGTDFYYRLTSYRGKYKAATRWKKANLRVGKGTANRVVGGRGHYLSYHWSKVRSASSYEIQLSTNHRFSGRVVQAGRKGLGARIDDLNGGMTYHARVRGVNGKVKGAWGPVTRTKLAAVPSRVTVATYNLCGEDKCRSADSGAWFLRNVPTWAVRKPLAGAVVRSGSPDVVVTQESATRTAFHTQLPGFTRGAYKSAKTIYFRSSRFTALGGGGLTLDSATGRYATWNLLRDRKTGTAFIVTNAHLEPHKGAARDELRLKQTARLISKVNALNPHRLPVVWGGDFNSNESNANQDNYPGGFDAPTQRFARHGIVNSLGLAGSAINAELNSANAGVPVPKSNGHHVDAIFVPSSGITVEAWSMPANFIQTETGREYSTPFPSDHNPVVARLVVATP